MKRRAFLKAAAGGLVVVIGAGAVLATQMPVTPEAPIPEPDAGMGWIEHQNGRYTLTLPRTEFGQNIATALKQIACAELVADWDDVDVRFHATDQIALVRSTVGSESVMFFAEPLAQACATLRDAVAAEQTAGVLTVTPRAHDQLLAFRRGALIGASPELEQGRGIVTGAPLYAADMRLPGMVYGRVLRAPMALETASEPVSWDLDAARDVPGFVAVVQDCGPAIGQAKGLGIVASRPGALDAIADALDVIWETGPAPAADALAVIDIDARLAQGDLPHVILDGKLRDGSWDVDLRIDIPLAAHGQIEPRAAMAHWESERLTVHTGTQDAFFVRAFLADALGIDGEDVTVRTCRVGGAFGGKMFCSVEAEAAALSRAVGVPVKVQWTRGQEYSLGFHRPPSSHRVRARVTDGRISDWSHDRISSHVIFSASLLPRWMQWGTDTFAGDEGAASGMAPPYDLGDARASYDLVRLPVHTGPWRGLGAGPNGLAVESAIDEAARSAGIDPVAFRLAHTGDDRLAGVLHRVAEVSNWGADPSPASGSRTGRGVACGIYNGKSYAAIVADVAVYEKGAVRVTKIWCAHDCGIIINPDQVRAQCEGNIVFSLGMVMGDALPVSMGRVTAETFMDAPIPTLPDVPPIVVDLIESNAPPTGAGETAMVAGPGAIANAIRGATGTRPIRFPILSRDR